MQLDPTTDQSFMAFLPGMPQEDDRSLIVRFFMAPKLLGLKSKEAGREIYEDREFIEIKIKGQDKQVVVHEVSEQHRRKYPIAYQQFLHRKPAPVVGTPIEQMPGIGPSMVHHLKGLNLRSVEDLASVSDENVYSAIGMGARDLVNKAKAWVSQQAPQTLALAEQLAAERAAREKLEQDREADRKAFEERLAALESQKAPKVKRAKKGGAKRIKAAPEQQEVGA